MLTEFKLKIKDTSTLFILRKVKYMGRSNWGLNGFVNDLVISCNPEKPGYHDLDDPEVLRMPLISAEFIAFGLLKEQLEHNLKNYNYTYETHTYNIKKLIDHIFDFDVDKFDLEEYEKENDKKNGKTKKQKSIS